MTTTLPTVPSQLIRLALADLRKVEEDPKYTVNMGSWHEGDPYHDAICPVCLAGAVMAKTIGVSRDEDVTPSDLMRFGRISKADRDALVALDFFRTGNVAQGLEELGVHIPSFPDDADIPPYGQDREGFHAAMNQLAANLEAEGH
jgi:hypothetical protein